jgi:hypothetical protein
LNKPKDVFLQQNSVQQSQNSALAQSICCTSCRLICMCHTICTPLPRVMKRYQPLEGYSTVSGTAQTHWIGTDEADQLRSCISIRHVYRARSVLDTVKSNHTKIAVTLLRCESAACHE